MTDFPERAVVVTANFGSFFAMALTYAMVNFVLFPSCNFLGLSTRDFSNYLEVCPARVLSGLFGCATFFLTSLLLCSMAGFLYSPFVSVIVSLSVLSRVPFCVSRPLCSQPIPLQTKKVAPSSQKVTGPEGHGGSRTLLKIR